MIMCSGASSGELLGSLLIFFNCKRFRTPIFWLRIDSLLMLATWIVPYWTPPPNEVNQAWYAMAAMIPIAFGWAASEVSLNAYVQSSLEKSEENKGVSSLKAVVSFLYCFQIVLYAGLGTLMGDMVDGSGDIQSTLWWVCGVQFTVISVMNFASTFVPKGACKLNPKVIGIALEQQQDEEKGKGKDSPDADEVWRRSIGSPVILEADTMPRAMPTSG